jgi:hypothetical protein
MRQINAAEGDVINIRSAHKLPKGTLMKLQPKNPEFLEIFNPRAVYPYAPDGDYPMSCAHETYIIEAEVIYVASI